MTNVPKIGWAILLAVSGAFAIPAMAEPDGHSASYIEGMRPLQGHARPPFHVKPSISTAAPTGLTPARVRRAYGFDNISNQGEGMVIGIVDAYDHPRIESDLGVFSSTFGLPPCTTSNGCFRKIYASGSKPRSDAGWSLEISMDVEWAHAIAPKAQILLVEAASSSFGDLMNAVDMAVQNGASAVSMSFGATEFSLESNYDSHFKSSGVTFLASSGDSGYGSEYPAASAFVVAVGGTTLNADLAGNYIGESAWSGSGGGLSAYEPEPDGQMVWPLPYAAKRGIPDVAYNGNPTTGFAVYDSVNYQGRSGWFQVAGTSAGAPQWAGLFAIANSVRVAAGKPTLSAGYNTLYAIGKNAYGSAYNDVATGSNGSCGTICYASGGYDYVTGLGSPRAAVLVQSMLNQP
ncbi:S53 family peptidase [Cupriavidus sp. UYPR2.512]|uniref:S53 family peptidase n=1 Tax=Cupriavidus sp. UYPR2.512 TaxID=1080187 RepID=UPI00039EB128|nr:S53 family peptidase [Cupriavidus sp. UYPR2.512]UIF84563.1 S53 family peptidase [Cupriavidus necator]